MGTRHSWAVLILVGALSAPVAGAALSAADLAQQAVIHRTKYGVPHIKAENPAAAGFAMGWCQMEDYPERLMRIVIGAKGQTALHFGGRGNLAADKLVLQARAYDRAVAHYDDLPEDVRATMEGFALGINHYLEKHPEDKKEWMGPVSNYDVAAIGQAALMQFAYNRGGIIQRFIAKQRRAERAAASRPREEEPIGSNMWAFAPSRTESGNAMLMGNPHLPWIETMTYYEAHVTIPGAYDFYGSTFIGSPVLTTGFNKALGWSHTVNYPDLEEIYALDKDPANPKAYLFDGESKPVTERENVVLLKQDDGKIESEFETFAYTHLGPVIYEDEDTYYTLKSVGYELYRAGEQWYRMGQAESYEEFRETLDIRSIAMFNICYADRDGNIFYIWNGSVPNIPHRNAFDTAVPASATDEIWTAYHTIDELPQLFNPPGGYVHNSNSPPYFTNLNVKMKRSDFPKHFPENHVSLRSQHSLSLIHNDKKFDLDEVVTMKHSMGMLLADRVKGDLIAAIEDTAPTGGVAEALDVLKAWDNTVARESAGGVLFETWWDRYSRGDTLYAEPWDEARPASTPRGLADTPRAVEAFTWAVEHMQRLYDELDTTWGELHRHRQGKLDLPIGGGSGSLGCFRILNFRKDKDDKRYAVGGDSWVFAVEFSDPPKARSVIAYSQSGREDSPHFNDQAALFANNAMKPVAFTDEQIQDQLIRTYRPGE